MQNRHSNFGLFGKSLVWLVYLAYIVAFLTISINVFSDLAASMYWVSLIEPLFKLRVSNLFKHAFETTMLPGPNLILMAAYPFKSWVLGLLSNAPALVGTISVGLIFRKIVRKLCIKQLVSFIGSLIVFQITMRTWGQVLPFPAIPNGIIICTVTAGYVGFWSWFAFWRKNKKLT
ncbi:MAG: hypothetical protein FD163_854 [Hyphomonadaceae bacterium]|nr:MAG: hypothetical protein FD128_1393 [Hyphomonadaceae bacterium]KAF0186186.1 MAG: hypothetical protein FD163_854 [Hyphomonadaceae bacterium]